MVDDQVCVVCGRPRKRHDGKVHAFAPPGVAVDTSQFRRRGPTTNMPGVRWDGSIAEPQAVTQVQFPFDPILRMALINKGILTHEDLKQAELQFRAVSGSAWVKEVDSDELVKTPGNEDPGPEPRN